MSVMLEEDDEEKLQYLISAMAVSNTYRKSINVTWLRYFDEGEARQSRLVMEALISY